MVFVKNKKKLIQKIWKMENQENEDKTVAPCFSPLIEILYSLA